MTDDIGRLLEELAAGHLTAAVPLLDLLREGGYREEAREVVELVGLTLERWEGVPAEVPEAHARRVGRSLWHLMPRRDEALREAEGKMLRKGVRWPRTTRGPEADDPEAPADG